MRYTFLASFAATALATAAFAQGGGMGMMRADTNHDGKVTRAEAEAEAGTRFDAMDVDKDGFLTADEMKGPNGQMGQRMMERAGGADMKISRADYVARADKRFERFDTNHDGLLTPDEIAAGRDRMRSAMGGQRRADPADAVAPPSPPPPSPNPGQ